MKFTGTLYKRFGGETCGGEGVLRSEELQAEFKIKVSGSASQRGTTYELTQVNGGTSIKTVVCTAAQNAPPHRIEVFVQHGGPEQAALGLTPLVAYLEAHFLGLFTKCDEQQPDDWDAQVQQDRIVLVTVFEDEEDEDLDFRLGNF